MHQPTILKNSKLNNFDKGQITLGNINEYFNSDLVYPISFLKLIDYSPQQIETIAIQEGWLDENDIDLIDRFEADLLADNFEIALYNYEKNVLELELSSAEFAKKNMVANAFKAIYHFNPEMFGSSKYGNMTGKGGWSCFRAGAALTVSNVALASCATTVACGLAITAWMVSYSAYDANC